MAKKNTSKKKKRYKVCPKCKDRILASMPRDVCENCEIPYVKK